jgi:hypothetical protein
MHCHKSKVPLYFQYLYVIVSEDVEKEIDQIRKVFNINTDRFDFAGYSECIDKFNVVVLNKKYLKDENFAIGTIAHESFHITSFIMKRVGIHPDVNNDESQAYLLSWVVEEVYKEFKKSK